MEELVLEDLSRPKKGVKKTQRNSTAQPKHHVMKSAVSQSHPLLRESIKFYCTSLLNLSRKKKDSRHIWENTQYKKQTQGQAGKKMRKTKNMFTDKNFKYLSLISPQDSERKYCLNETKTEYTKKRTGAGPYKLQHKLTLKALCWGQKSKATFYMISLLWNVQKGKSIEAESKLVFCQGLGN